jgi:hypothetical protein
MVHEDFYPISESEALITVGSTYTRLNEIRKVKYKVEGHKVILLESTLYLQGIHMRLGNIFEGKLFYSDNNRLYYFDKGIGSLELQGEQPYATNLGLFYTHNRSVYLNDNVIISLWEDFDEIGNVCVDSDWIYFETRRKKNPAPQGWEIWKFNINTKEKQQVVKHGANPDIYSGKLYYSIWGERGFETVMKELI